MRPDGALLVPSGGWQDHVPVAWRMPLLRLAMAWIVLAGFARADWAEMAWQWWNASTYNHILLIPPILVWLVQQRWSEVARLSPRTWWPGLLALGLALLVWRSGTAFDINLVSQLGAVMMLQAAVATLLGPRASIGLLFPLAYMLFLVPFGDEVIPPMQAITATLAVWLTHASGVPAFIDGVFIDTPAGLFEVAEACSGVKFLVAMVALGALAAHVCFVSIKRRVVFMMAAVIVPVLANGVRAWGTIYIAQSQGIEFAAGFDHIVYGWIFFALVMVAVIGGAWRYFDRSPEDPLIDVASIEASPLFASLERYDMDGWKALAGILLLVGVAVWIDPIVRVP